MKYIFPIISLFISIDLVAQVNCSNWLYISDLYSGVTIGDLDVKNNAVTIEATCNAKGTLTRSLVSKHSDPSNVNYFLCPELAQITTTNGFFSVSAPCGYVNDKTYHSALVYNGSTLKLYVNGFLMGQVPATGNLVTNDIPTTIGERAQSILSGSGTNAFQGYINEVRIWNIARTQEEIKAYMKKNLPNPRTQVGLKGYYVFDNLVNKQGNIKFNGKLYNVAKINATNPNCNFTADSCAIIKEKKEIIEVDGQLEYSISKCNQVNFNIANAKNIKTVQWQLGDKTTSTKDEFTHIYKKDGSYEVMLTIKGTNGQKKKITKSIAIRKPIASFSFKSSNNPLKIQFKNTSKEKVNYKWVFGDGEKLISNTTKAFAHTYAEPGTYAVQLVAEDKATGCTNTATQKVVIEKPSVVVTADVNLSTEPKTVTAENLPTVDILLEKRISNLVRQIEVVNDSVQVSFYDNGEIDGDSITVSYNNKIITQHLLLTANGKTFTIKVEPAPAQNELIMYAENLGSIPPNTAIMIIYDGKARYEVNISSNNESNGKVSFTLKQ